MKKRKGLQNIVVSARKPDVSRQSTKICPNCGEEMLLGWVSSHQNYMIDPVTQKAHYLSCPVIWGSLRK